MAVDYGGKFGVASLLATRKRNSGGKLELSAKFATREDLEKPDTAWWQLIMVANLELLLYLPPERGILVANGVAVPDLPPKNSRNS